MTDNIAAALHETFGFQEFRPGQREVIDRIMADRSALAVFPTGSGKSLCYQLPSLLRPGLTLVVSPLLALMKDQVDALREKGVAAARLDSSLDPPARQALMERLRAGEIRLLYVAPERFANESFLGLVAALAIGMMVVDEAHCISEWGHNFRPDYLKLAEMARKLSVPVVLTLTATATPKVATDIRRAFGIAEQDLVCTGFYRPNLGLFFPAGGDRDALLQQRLKKMGPGPAIVYVTRQETAEQVAEMLHQSGFPARHYHAGMKSEEREQVQEWFMAADNAVVAATIAFGMGIDKENIRGVFHYNLPKSLENYAQEIGRAGRDGRPAVCEVLGDRDDLTTLRGFIDASTPADREVVALVRKLCAMEERFSVSLFEEAGAHSMNPLTVKTLLAYLELEGVLASTGPFFTSCAFIPNRPSRQILARFDHERAEFLRTLFRFAQKARVWFQLDLDAAAQATASPRARVVAALNYLDEQGDIRLRLTGGRLGYKRLWPRGKKSGEVEQKLVKRFALRAANDHKRLNQVVDFVERRACKTKYLLDYFGEDLGKNCGHCQWCLDKGKQ